MALFLPASMLSVKIYVKFDARVWFLEFDCNSGFGFVKVVNLSICLIRCRG